jgi:hypothetical protein
MAAPVTEKDPAGAHEDRPPLLRTWPLMYLAVASWLAFLIIVFYWFTRRFAP